MATSSSLVLVAASDFDGAVGIFFVATAFGAAAGCFGAGTEDELAASS